MNPINYFLHLRIIRRLLAALIILSGLIISSNGTMAEQQSSMTISASVVAITPVPSSTPVNNPPGGGGGSSYIPPVTGVIFKGRAYPLSKVTILKDGQTAMATIAGPDANFYVSLSGLSAGNYLFSVFGEDSGGERSSLFTFPIFITQGVLTQISGIFIAPTIDVDKSEVKRGENIAIFGQSAPESEVTIAVNSDTGAFVKTQADKNGAYLYNFDTSGLEEGSHSTKSKAALDGQVSPFGKLISFAVGSKTIKGIRNIIVDLNGDTKVDLTDFSVLLYWWMKPNANADLNGNGIVDLADFSILLYHWSG